MTRRVRQNEKRLVLVGDDGANIDKAARDRGLVYEKNRPYRFNKGDARLHRNIRTLELESEMCGEDKW